MFCPNCGAQAPDGSSNCPNCGVPLAANSAPVPPPAAPQGNPYGTYNNGNPYNAVPPTGKEPRNIAIAIILTIVTCGIYGIYWFIVLTNETNEAACEPNGTSGGIAFLLTLVTAAFTASTGRISREKRLTRQKICGICRPAIPVFCI